jgi:hypothetical protein
MKKKELLEDADEIIAVLLVFLLFYFAVKYTAGL